MAAESVYLVRNNRVRKHNSTRMDEGRNQLNNSRDKNEGTRSSGEGRAEECLQCDLIGVIWVTKDREREKVVNRY